MTAGLLACLLLSLPVRAGETDAHSGPVPYAAEAPAAPSTERRRTLAEMWQRRVLPPETDTWSPEDLALLGRVRRAEAAGALADLRRRYGGLKDLAVAVKDPGERLAALRLTRLGFEKYLFNRSQEALRYFEGKGVDTKWAFSLTDLEGRRLFEPGGLLTADGEELYAKVLAGKPAHWQTASGEVFGNRPPPRRPQPIAAPAPPPRPAQRAPVAGTAEPPKPNAVAVSTETR